MIDEYNNNDEKEDEKEDDIKEEREDENQDKEDGAGESFTRDERRARRHALAKRGKRR